MTEQAISPLRRRMIEDMTIRKFAQKTQHDYVRRVKEFASYLKRSPDTAKPEDVRGFQLHLTSSGAGTPKINATVAALRFFFRVTLDRPDLGRHLSTIHEPRKAPVILSPDEMARFLEAAPGIKYKAALRLWRGAARLRDCLSEGHRYRFRTHDVAHRTGQGSQMLYTTFATLCVQETYVVQGCATPLRCVAQAPLAAT
jgi:integrase